MLNLAIIISLLAPTLACQDPNSSSCDSSGKSITCKTGFLLSGTTCVTCPGACNKCPNGVCNACPSNCGVCSNGVCKQCNSGYYISKNNCFACDTPCKTCSASSKTCTTCIDGYVFSSSGNTPNCVPNANCPQNCASCKSPLACSACISGFYVDKNNNCSPCSTQFCIDCNSANNCKTCSKGYTLIQGVCQPCSNGCSVCKNKETCTECSFGYSLISNSCCEIGCLSCKDTICSKCDDAHILANGKCLPPDPPTCVLPFCDTCLSESACKACFPGYYVSNGKCVNCYETCSSCDSQQKCTGCVSGYSLKSGSCCRIGCSSCRQNECWTCEPNYYLSNGICISSSLCSLPNCSDCSDGKSCKVCDSGFYRAGSGCLPCVGNCKTCSGQFLCKECNQGYALIDGYCCETGCVSCSVSRCWRCDQNFNYIGGTCVIKS